MTERHVAQWASRSGRKEQPLRILQLRTLQTTPMAAVTILELLLGRAPVWGDAASRGATRAAQLKPLERLVVNQRGRQLLAWKSPRQARERHRERHWERNGAEDWMSFVAMLDAAEDAAEVHPSGLHLPAQASPAEAAGRRSVALGGRRGNFF